MKQLLLTISALLFATAVCAEGYQVNTLSAKQLGMGHVGTGMKPVSYTHLTLPTKA